MDASHVIGVVVGVGGPAPQVRHGIARAVGHELDFRRVVLGRELRFDLMIADDRLQRHLHANRDWLEDRLLVRKRAYAQSAQAHTYTHSHFSLFSSTYPCFFPKFVPLPLSLVSRPDTHTLPDTRTHTRTYTQTRTRARTRAHTTREH